MFKKLLCMAALSLALVSSQNASASGKCIVSECSPYNSSALYVMIFQNVQSIL